MDTGTNAGGTLSHQRRNLDSVVFVQWKRGVRLTTNLEGRFEFEQNWLAEEDLPGFEAEAADFILCQLNVFARSGAFHCKDKGRD